VTIRGQREALAAVGADAIDAFVELKGLGPGQYNLKIQIDPSQIFGVGTVTPGNVSVTIK
jgi:hypothetical protein